MAIDRSTYEGRFLYRIGSHLRDGSFLMNLYKKCIEEETSVYPEFSTNLRTMSLAIINEGEDIDMIPNALQALAVVGKKEDIPVINKVHALQNEDLSIDVKTCIFEITHR